MTMRSSGSPVWSRSPPTGRPRRTSPSSAAMCWPRRSSTSSRPRGPAAATRSSSPTPCRSSPERRTATVSTESCSRAPAMTPVTSSTTSRPSCRSPATARTSARISRDGSRATFPHSTDRNPRADRDRGSAGTSGPTETEPESEGSRVWPVILTDRQSDIVLRPLRRRDEQQWREVRRFNRDWLRPWDATLPAPGQELPGFRSMVRMQDRQAKRSQSVPFAIAMAVGPCFFTLGLHRIEINIRPENTASLRVVDKLGLRDEGLRKRYMHIDGQWCDHRTFAVLAEEVPHGLLAAYRYGQGGPASDRT